AATYDTHREPEARSFGCPGESAIILSLLDEPGVVLRPVSDPNLKLIGRGYVLFTIGGFHAPIHRVCPRGVQLDLRLHHRASVRSHEAAVRQRYQWHEGAR